MSSVFFVSLLHSLQWQRRRPGQWVCLTDCKGVTPRLRPMPTTQRLSLQIPTSLCRWIVIPQSSLTATPLYNISSVICMDSTKRFDFIPSFANFDPNQWRFTKNILQFGTIQSDLVQCDSIQMDNITPNTYFQFCVNEKKNEKQIQMYFKLLSICLQKYAPY